MENQFRTFFSISLFSRQKDEEHFGTKNKYFHKMSSSMNIIVVDDDNADAEVYILTKGLTWVEIIFVHFTLLAL
jgi:hypothetical protein